MAISFPANPTTNQIYTYGTQTWAYNGSTWVQNIPTGALIQVANTAPTTAQLGSLWWDSDSGDFSVYYNNAWAGLTASGLVDNSVTTSKIVDGAVTTTKIVDGAVTAAKLATNQVMPTQTGNSGKYLTTDGTTASWASAGSTGKTIALNMFLGF